MNTMKTGLKRFVMVAGILAGFLLIGNTSWATTFDLRSGSATRLRALDNRGTYVAVKRVSFVDTPTTNADTVQIMDIPAGTMVIGVAVKVITAEGTACTVDVGDVADPNGWIAAVSTNATAGTLVGNTGAYNTAVKFYQTAAVLSITGATSSGNSSVNVGVIDVAMICVPIFLP